MIEENRDLGRRKWIAYWRRRREKEKKKRKLQTLKKDHQFSLKSREVEKRFISLELFTLLI